MIEKIPIEEAIQAGSWLTCENDDCRLKIRLEGLSEADPSAVATQARMQGREVGNARAVILYLTIINACSNLLVYQLLKKILRIIDEHGCDYCSIDSESVTEESTECKELPITLYPEEAAKGKFTFLLPEKDAYYFGIVEGCIQED